MGDRALTTVGYGDVNPLTAEGRSAASAPMLLGFGLFRAVIACACAAWLASVRRMASVDEFTRTVVAGLLGGGVAGTVIGGLIGLWTQARGYRREDRFRFNESKREKYASFYVLVDAWLRAVNDHYYALLAHKFGRPKPIRPASEPSDLQRLAQEVRLLGDSDVEAAASNLMAHVAAVEHIRVRLTDEGESAVRTEQEANELGFRDDPTAVRLGESWTYLDAFFQAARVDLGTVRVGMLRRLGRRLERLLRRLRH